MLGESKGPFLKSFSGFKSLVRCTSCSILSLISYEGDSSGNCSLWADFYLNFSNLCLNSLILYFSSRWFFAGISISFVFIMLLISRYAYFSFRFLIMPSRTLTSDYRGLVPRLSAALRERVCYGILISKN